MTRPTVDKSLIESLVREKSLYDDRLSIIGIRGFFSVKNDRGVYDDAHFLVSPGNIIPFNANTDPSRYGMNHNVGKGMAVLQYGVWLYKVGLHGIKRGNPYKALVQAEKVTVIRDGGLKESGFFGINIHKGSNRSTSSEGCQTIPPEQWDDYIEFVRHEMNKYEQKIVQYCLV